MINYRYLIKDGRGQNLEVVSGYVSDKGNVVINMPRRPQSGSIEIIWEVTGGNYDHDEPGND